MNQLLELLNVLRPEEVEHLRNAAFRGNEGKLLDYLLEIRQQPLAENQVVLDRFGFTRNYYYKLLSTLQRRCYQVLVPDGGTSLIRWLNRRSLNDHAFHEVKLQEKDITESGNTEDLARFYQECLLIFQRNSRHRQHVKIPEYLADKLLTTNPGDPYFRQFCAIQLFLAHTWAVAAKGNAHEERESMAAEYLTLENAVAGTAFRDLELEFRKAAGNYYVFIWDDNIAALDQFREALAIAQRMDMPASETYSLEAKMAELKYFTSRFEEAFEHYAGLFDRHPEIASQDLYHHSKFFQVCIVIGRHDDIRKRIDAVFGDHVRGVNPNTVVMGCLNYLKMYLSLRDCASAKPYLALGREMLDKNSFFQYDIELRFLEEYYFYLKEETETCLSLIRRDLKFLRQKNRLPGNSELPWFPMMLQELMDIRDGIRTRMRPRFRPHLEVYQESSYAVYGRLLQQEMVKLGF